MAPDPRMDDPDLRIRPARGVDLRHLAAVEASGGDQFVAWFGPDLNPVLLATPPTGAWRDEQPGFLLVAAPVGAAAPWEQGRPSEPVGFAHVVDHDGHAHLEQLSVRPEAQRRGIGGRLVRAALAEARALGYVELSLCTYLDVPWNGPFYAGLGFTVVAELSAYQRGLRDHERSLGLEQDGVRVVMQVPLRAQVTRG